jgi:hypothetical protein
MRVLIGCEFSGRTRDAFKALGHEAYSCDLEASETGGNHIHGDLLEIMNDGSWDLGIMHPPCTHLTVSGARWFKEKRADGRQQKGIEFFMAVANCKIPKLAIENPVGIMSTLWRKPDQIIQPYQFGDSFQKTTCLWLKNLPKLVPTNIVDRGEQVTLKSGKVMAKWSAFAPVKDRVKIRNRTFPGIAAAFADQWGGDVNAEVTEELETIRKNADLLDQ